MNRNAPGMYLHAFSWMHCPPFAQIPTPEQCLKIAIQLLHHHRLQPSALRCKTAKEEIEYTIGQRVQVPLGHNVDGR